MNSQERLQGVYVTLSLLISISNAADIKRPVHQNLKFRNSPTQGWFICIGAWTSQRDNCPGCSSSSLGAKLCYKGPGPWFCLWLRRGLTSLHIKSSFMWKSEWFPKSLLSQFSKCDNSNIYNIFLSNFEYVTVCFMLQMRSSCGRSCGVVSIWLFPLSSQGGHI